MRRSLIFLYILIFISASLLPLNGQNYKRIISLAPSLTMNLYYLESQDKLVGCTSYCEIAKGDNKTIVATAVKANIEQIVGLNPDLVLVTSIMSAETVEILKKFGIRVEVFHTPKSFQEICTQFERIGMLIGKSSLAEEIVTITKSRVQELNRQCKWTTPPDIFIQLGAKPLYAVIPETFTDDYIHFVNGRNIASDMVRGTIAREVVIARDPDIIFIVTMGILAEEEKKNWQRINTMSATESGNIFIIDSNMACTPTPISFVKTLEEIIQLIKSNYEG